jgi:hypothetical protein
VRLERQVSAALFDDGDVGEEDHPGRRDNGARQQTRIRQTEGVAVRSAVRRMHDRRHPSITCTRGQHTLMRLVRYRRWNSSGTLGLDSGGAPVSTRKYVDPDLGTQTAITKFEYDASNPGRVNRIVPPRGLHCGLHQSCDHRLHLRHEPGLLRLG